jgi:hypothetical protein
MRMLKKTKQKKLKKNEKNAGQVTAPVRMLKRQSSMNSSVNSSVAAVNFFLFARARCA